MNDAQKDAAYDHYDKRKNRFRALAESFWITINEDDPDDEYGWQLTEQWEIERWALVLTTGGGQETRKYALSTFPNLRQAEAKATEYIMDDVYAEFPYAIVDLDSDAQKFGRAYLLKNVTVDFGI